MASKKTHNNKKDFIDELLKMSDVEINDFIKANGKPPKPLVLFRLIDKKLQQ